MGAAKERTLSIIKPDAVAKNVIGEITSRFEKAGLRVVAVTTTYGREKLFGADRIVVRLQAPVDLPLAIPGSPGSASVAATGSSSLMRSPRSTRRSGERRTIWARASSRNGHAALPRT